MSALDRNCRLDPPAAQAGGPPPPTARHDRAGTPPRRYKPYPAYKDSGVEWLGEIPAHWEVRRADSFLRYDKIQIEPSEMSQELVFHYSIPAVQEIGDGALESPSEIDSAKLRVVGKRLLVSKLNPRKGVVLVAAERDVPTICSTEFVPFEVRGCDLRWALYLFLAESTRQRLSAVVRSATRSHQRAEVSEIVKIWHGVPTIPEQRAIAAFLDRETARIDALVAKKERLIALLEEKRTALITRAVTKGLDPHAPMKDSGVEWLGEIPAHWEVKPNIALFSQRDERGRDDLPILEVSISAGVRVREFSNTKIEQRSDDLGAYKVAQAGDIAFNKMRMWQGAVGMTPVAGLVSPDYIVATARAAVDPRYFAALFRTPLYMAETYRWSHGIVDDRNRLYWEEFKTIRSPVPPTNEQHAIAAFLDRETAKIDALVAKVREAIERLKELRTALISAAVTGKIDVSEG